MDEAFKAAVKEWFDVERGNPTSCVVTCDRDDLVIGGFDAFSSHRNQQPGRGPLPRRKLKGSSLEVFRNLFADEMMRLRDEHKNLQDTGGLESLQEKRKARLQATPKQSGTKSPGTKAITSVTGQGTGTETRATPGGVKRLDLDHTEEGLRDPKKLRSKEAGAGGLEQAYTGGFDANTSLNDSNAPVDESDDEVQLIIVEEDRSTLIEKTRKLLRALEDGKGKLRKDICVEVDSCIQGVLAKEHEMEKPTIVGKRPRESGRSDEGGRPLKKEFSRLDDVFEAVWTSRQDSGDVITKDEAFKLVGMLLDTLKGDDVPQKVSPEVEALSVGVCGAPLGTEAAMEVDQEAPKGQDDLEAEASVGSVEVAPKGQESVETDSAKGSVDVAPKGSDGVGAREASVGSVEVAPKGSDGVGADSSKGSVEEGSAAGVEGAPGSTEDDTDNDSADGGVREDAAGSTEHEEEPAGDGSEAPSDVTEDEDEEVVLKRRRSVTVTDSWKQAYEDMVSLAFTRTRQGTLTLKPSDLGELDKVFPMQPFPLQLEFGDPPSEFAALTQEDSVFSFDLPGFDRQLPGSDTRSGGGDGAFSTFVNTVLRFENEGASWQQPDGKYKELKIDAEKWLFGAPPDAMGQNSLWGGGLQGFVFEGDVDKGLDIALGDAFDLAPLPVPFKEASDHEEVIADVYVTGPKTAEIKSKRTDQAWVMVVADLGTAVLSVSPEKVRAKASQHLSAYARSHRNSVQRYFLRSAKLRVFVIPPNHLYWLELEPFTLCRAVAFPKSWTPDDLPLSYGTGDQGQGGTEGVKDKEDAIEEQNIVPKAGILTHAPGTLVNWQPPDNRAFEVPVSLTAAVSLTNPSKGTVSSMGRDGLLKVFNAYDALQKLARQTHLSSDRVGSLPEADNEAVENLFSDDSATIESIVADPGRCLSDVAAIELFRVLDAQKESANRKLFVLASLIYHSVKQDIDPLLWTESKQTFREWLRWFSRKENCFLGYNEDTNLYEFRGIAEDCLKIVGEGEEPVIIERLGVADLSQHYGEYPELENYDLADLQALVEMINWVLSVVKKETTFRDLQTLLNFVQLEYGDCVVISLPDRWRVPDCPLSSTGRYILLREGDVERVLVATCPVLRNIFDSVVGDLGRLTSVDSEMIGYAYGLLRKFGTTRASRLLRDFVFVCTASGTFLTAYGTRKWLHSGNPGNVDSLLQLFRNAAPECREVLGRAVLRPPVTSVTGDICGNCANPFEDEEDVTRCEGLCRLKFHKGRCAFGGAGDSCWQCGIHLLARSVLEEEGGERTEIWAALIALMSASRSSVEPGVISSFVNGACGVCGMAFLESSQVDDTFVRASKDSRKKHPCTCKMMDIAFCKNCAHSLKSDKSLKDTEQLHVICLCEAQRANLVPPLGLPGHKVHVAYIATSRQYKKPNTRSSRSKPEGTSSVEVVVVPIGPALPSDIEMSEVSKKWYKATMQQAAVQRQTVSDEPPLLTGGTEETES